jgi:hypothetical protein
MSVQSGVATAPKCGKCGRQWEGRSGSAADKGPRQALGCLAPAGVRDPVAPLFMLQHKARVNPDHMLRH